MYEAPESRAREARGTHRDVGRAHLWWRQRLEGQWGQQESRVGQQGLEEPRIRLEERRLEGERRLGVVMGGSLKRPGGTRRLGGFPFPGGGATAGGAARPTPPR